jgi:hypothetical protein
MNKRLNLISIIAGILLLMPWTTSDATEGDWRHNDSQTIQDAIALLESDTPAELTDELSALRTAYDAFETMRLAYDPTPPDPPAPPDPPEPPPTGSDPVLSSVGTSWTQVTPGMPLLVHENTNAYSGGVFCHGRWYILGGGHANSYNDAVAMLDVSTFSTVGFWEEFQSTADYLGVSDWDFPAIVSELNANYIGDGMFDRNGELGRISHHTYDQSACTSTGFINYGGEHVYDTPYWLSVVWPTRVNVAARYENGIWSVQTTSIPDFPYWEAGNLAVVADPENTDIHWVLSSWILYRYDTLADSWEYVTDLNNWNAEGWIEATPGQIHVGGGYGVGTWSTYDIASDTWSIQGSIPGDSRMTAVTVGPNNELYAYYGGNLWNMSRNNILVASGGLSQQNHTYGRFIYDPQHGVFIVTDNFNDGAGWQVWAVKP